MNKWIVGSLCMALMGLAPPTFAAPTTFEPVIGGALLCRDQIDPSYFKDYLTRFYQFPYKTEGEAYWFKPEAEQKIFDMVMTDIFVSTESSRYLFLGVIFREPLDSARKKMLEMKGIEFLPYSGDKVLRSAQGSFLIEYDNNQTKLYCAKHRITQ